MKPLTATAIVLSFIFMFMGLAFMVTSIANAEEEYTCNGIPATIVGTEGDDVINGTPEDDVIVGLGGNDRIRGYEGNDVICSGEGDNVIGGGPGEDILITNIDGINQVFGASDADVCYVNPNDILSSCNTVIFLEENPINLEVGGETMVTVTLDKESYQEGDTMIISGTIDNRVEGTVTTVSVTRDHLIPNPVELTLQPDNTFSHSFTLTRLFSSGTEPIVKVSHGVVSATVISIVTPSPPTEVFIVENARLIDPVTGRQITSVQTGKTIQILIRVENDQSEDQDYLLETNTVGFEPQTRSQTGLIESGQTLNLMYDFRAVQPGNYIISIETFDNSTNRNTIAPTLTLNLTVTGEPIITQADLLARIIVLEDKVATLEAAR